MPDETTAAKPLAEYAEKLLAAEMDQRTFLQTRAGAVITGSGALVTALVGIAALITGRGPTALPGAARWLLLAAIAALAVAAVCAIATFAPRRQAVINVSDARTEMRRLFAAPENDGLKKATTDRLSWIEVLQEENDRRARILLVAVGFQVLAVVLLGVEVAALLL